MKLLWLDLNSSFAHSSLALPAIHAQAQQEESGVEWMRVSATINSNVGGVVAEIVACSPDVLAATAWLFTHDVLLKIVARVKVLLPQCVVIFGGPEMLGNNEEYLRRNPFVNCVFRGEGELGFHDWLRVFRQMESWENVEGLCWIDDSGRYHDRGIARILKFDQLKTPECSRFFDWTKPFVQLETTRGCFNTCAFCVSGTEKPVRVLPVEQVRERLLAIRAHGIHDIRLLDRTFNGSSNRAIALLNLFREFAGEMRFHLEIHPALLSREVKALLKEMPRGLLHLEAGIQSLRQEVLHVCHRLGNLSEALEGLRYLSSLSNIVVHADLIAGLPLYNLRQIMDDVCTLVSFGTDEIQLELLKLLPGTSMRREAALLGIVYSPEVPYEVLRTNEMSVEDLKKSRLLSRLIDGYYNTVAWQGIIRKLVLSSVDFLPRFQAWLTEQDLLDQPLSLERRGVLLYDFCSHYYPDFLTEVSVAWVLAGIPLAKEPGRKIRSWNSSLPKDMQVVLGEYAETMRIYYMQGQTKEYWFGFDRSKSASKPLFMAIR